MVRLYGYLFSLTVLLWIFTERALSHPIVNGAGSPADLRQFIFAVSLQRRLSNGTLMHFCGGTYLGSGWILSATHCVVGFHESGEIYARLGGVPMGTVNGSNVHRIRQVFSYPDFNPVTLGGDIALLRLDNAIDQQNKTFFTLMDKMVTSTLLLPTSSINSRTENSFGNLNGVVNEQTKGAEECHIFGYGSASFYGPISDQLQYGPVDPLSFDQCVQMLGPVVAPVAPDSGMFCAIGTSDACRGDSGSGLVCRQRSLRSSSGGNIFGPYTLRGIISYGAGCGAPASPGVYTDVGFYSRWIGLRTSFSQRQMPKISALVTI